VQFSRSEVLTAVPPNNQVFHEILCHVDWYTVTDILIDHTAFIFRVQQSMKNDRLLDPEGKETTVL
jgi:hypothetical protein